MINVGSFCIDLSHISINKEQTGFSEHIITFAQKMNDTDAHVRSNTYTMLTINAQCKCVKNYKPS